MPSSCKPKPLISEATLMAVVMMLIELAITAFVIQFAWNYVLTGENNAENPEGAAKGAVAAISFWDALLISVATKIMSSGLNSVKELF